MKHFNNLAPPELERLAYLVEEMGETLQSIGKILRHGYDSRDPTKPKSLTNREDLEVELRDVLIANSMLVKAEDVNSDRLTDGMEEKEASLQQWLHHQG